MTRQGIYLLTASGKLLGYAYGDVEPKRFHEILLEALATWDRLPESERRPGAAAIPALGATDSRFVRTPPPQGLILSVHSRSLVRGEDGALQAATGKMHLLEGDLPVLAQPDRLWLTEAEWRSLVPLRPRPGDRMTFPLAITQRLARFHLVDDTRGEMPEWKPDEVRFAHLESTVEQTSPAGISLRIDGAAAMARPADAEGGARSFVTRVLGYLHYDAGQDRIDRFQMVAVGDHRGNGPYTAAPRPGLQTLGIAFELLQEGSPFARIPPHGARNEADYFGLPAALQPGASGSSGTTSRD